MIWNKDNFFKQMNILKFDREEMKTQLLESIENYEPTHFFIYQNFDNEYPDVLENIDLVFCNKDSCYNIYLIINVEDIIIDYDYTYSINIKILEEKL